MSIDVDADSGLPRSYLRAALLVLLCAGPTHGYELLEQVRDLGMRVDAGGLYRALRAMERDELVASWWEESELGPPRRTYEIAGAGRTTLEAEVVRLRRRMSFLVDLTELAESSVDQTERDWSPR